jgi:hypothetical protein
MTGLIPGRYILAIRAGWPKHMRCIAICAEQEDDGAKA